MSIILERARRGARPVIGMVQLGPLAGGSRHRGEPIDGVLDAAVTDAALLARHGIDAVMVQNLGDLPTALHVAMPQVAWMTRIVSDVQRTSGLPVGLNFLENDAAAMFAVAAAAPVDFVRIKVFVGAMTTPSGIEGGQAFAAQRARNAWGAGDTAILADVHDRTGVPLGTAGLAEDIHHAVALGGADGIVLTGRSWQETCDFITTGRQAAHGAPLLIGGSVSGSNYAAAHDLADGVIVSSCLKADETPFGRIDADRLDRFMRTVRAVRAGHSRV